MAESGVPKVRVRCRSCRRAEDRVFVAGPDGGLVRAVAGVERRPWGGGGGGGSMAE